MILLYNFNYDNIKELELLNIEIDGSIKKTYKINGETHEEVIDYVQIFTENDNKKFYCNLNKTLTMNGQKNKVCDLIEIIGNFLLNI